ncbi:MAG: stalk domain-containing protein [Syntrophomonas sp.]
MKECLGRLRSLFLIVVMLACAVGPQAAFASENPPFTPNNLIATVSGSDVVLKWTDNSDNELGFLVERKSSTGGWNEIGNTNPGVVSFPDQPAVSGSYFYRIRAYNNYGTSAYSNEVDVNTVPASYKITIILQIDNPNLTVNGKNREIDSNRGTVPVIIDGRTLLPITAIIQQLGGTISWEEVTQNVSISDKGTTIDLWIGDSSAYVNGNKKHMDVAPTIINGRTMMPIAFIAENLGASVDWDAVNRVVTIRR